MAGEKSKIELQLDEMENYIESCRAAFFSTDKVTISKDEIFGFMDELRHDIPDEIKKARKVLKNRDSIIAAANEEAERIKAEAREEAARLVDESEVMEQAYEQSDQIVNEALDRANETKQAASDAAGDIMQGSLSYANELLAAVEKIVSHAYDTTKVRSDNLVEELRSNLEILQNNREQILAQLDNSATAPDKVPEEETSEIDDTINEDDNSEAAGTENEETSDGDEAASEDNFRVDLSGIDVSDNSQEEGEPDDTEESDNVTSSQDGGDPSEDELNMKIEDLLKDANVRGKHDPDPDDE